MPYSGRPACHWQSTPIDSGNFCAPTCRATKTAPRPADDRVLLPNSLRLATRPASSCRTKLAYVLNTPSKMTIDAPVTDLRPELALVWRPACAALAVGYST